MPSWWNDFWLTHSTLHHQMSKVEEHMERLRPSNVPRHRGAFDVIEKAMSTRGFPEIIIWLDTEYTKRPIPDDTPKAQPANGGLLKAWVLPPLMCFLVVDELVETLMVEGFLVYVYAENVTLFAKSRFLSVLRDNELCSKYTDKRCSTTKLLVNSNKTSVMIFIRKFKVIPETLEIGRCRNKIWEFIWTQLFTENNTYKLIWKKPMPHSKS